jgi:hypothetical protein
MMETERVSEMDFCSELTWMVAREDFITFSHCESSSHKFYICLHSNSLVIMLHFDYTLI